MERQNNRKTETGRNKAAAGKGKRTREAGKEKEREGEDERELVALKFQGLKGFTEGPVWSPRHSPGTTVLSPEGMGIG